MKNQIGLTTPSEKQITEKGVYIKPDNKQALKVNYDNKEVVIIGAGIAGLVTALYCLSEGYQVTILEKRTDFTRKNVINLTHEVEQFFDEFGLFDAFYTSVAAELAHHDLVHIENNTILFEDVEEVASLSCQHQDISSQELENLFKHSGVYSVRICDVQAFLANEVSRRGATIYYGATHQVNQFSNNGGIEILDVIADEKVQMRINPSMVFISDGAHSKTAVNLGFNLEEHRENITNGEQWVYANLPYDGDRSFVIPVIDSSNDNLKIANVIFNHKLRCINVAITIDNESCASDYAQEILNFIKKLYKVKGLGIAPERILDISKNPVFIYNEKRTEFSRDNIFCIGDAAGNSSPLAGLGGTLALCMVPLIIKKLLFNNRRHNESLHSEFNHATSAVIDKWADKSAKVKAFAQSKASPLFFARQSERECCRTIDEKASRFGVK